MPTEQTTDEVPWLRRDQQEHWIALMGVISTLPAALDAQLKRDAGLNLYEYQVLVQLSESPSGTVPMSDLAMLASGSLSRLSHAVGRLERAGYVSRVACREQGRRTAAVLTEAGRTKLEQTAPGHVREARRLVIDALTPEQLTVLGGAARQILEVTAPDVAAMLRP